MQHFGGFGVRLRDDARQRLDDGYLGAEAVPDRAKLQADVAAADDNQVGRHLIEGQRLGRTHDAGAIEGQGREPDRLAARGEDDVFRTQAGRRLLAALTALDGYFVSLSPLTG